MPKKKKWSEELIVKRILALYAKGEDLTGSAARKSHSRLASAGVAYFGSWSNALDAAGIDWEKIARVSAERRIEKIVKWTGDRLAGEIQALSEEGADLSCGYMKHARPDLMAAAVKRRGSWKSAVEASGLNYDEIRKRGRSLSFERGKGWRQALLLDRLREVIEEFDELDEKTVKASYPGFYKILIKTFGDWDKTLSRLSDPRLAGILN